MPMKLFVPDSCKFATRLASALEKPADAVMRSSYLFIQYFHAVNEHDYAFPPLLLIEQPVTSAFSMKMREQEEKVSVTAKELAA